jgi:oligopeptide/dipeptide ABC transporter ATP-binding protein
MKTALTISSDSTEACPPLLEASTLKVYFPAGSKLFGSNKVWVKAVDGVSLHLEKGETLGLVGESGCGKSTLARALLGLIPLHAGKVAFEGRDLADYDKAGLALFRRKVQMVFQDPYASLNPRMTLESTLTEPIKVHALAKGAELGRRVAELLDMVGLPLRALRKYPHEFSGGQRQRIVIARALAMNPEVLIADEPVSSLDVSIQAQILNLLASLKKDLGLSLIFIAHDLSVVRHVSDRIAVMYLGRVVEEAPSDILMDRPAHPYSRALISAIPLPDPVLARSIRPLVPQGEIPSPMNPPSGCPFHPRCPFSIEQCSAQQPSLEFLAKGRNVSCLRRDILPT